jgi:hypothetical protein
MPLLFSVCGIFMGCLFNAVRAYYCVPSKKKNFKKLNIYFLYATKKYCFFSHKWYFDYIYNYYPGYYVLKYAYKYFYRLIDKGFLELIGGKGPSVVCYEIYTFLNCRTSGYIYKNNCLLILHLIVLLFLVIVC